MIDEVLDGRRSWWVECCDVLDGLKAMPSGSVHCVVTSPPYFGLRDYKAAGQIGLEPDLGAYLDRLVAVFAEVRRVLRRDGTCWVVMGDSFATNPGNGRGGEAVRRNAPLTGGAPHRSGRDRRHAGGYKPKDLMGVPWRLAFALQAEGWYLRSDIVWAKPNPMPESVTDRPTRSHEYLFMLTKSATYWYDADAIREEASENTHTRGNGVGPKNAGTAFGQGVKHNQDYAAAINGFVTHRNKRSVWTIATQARPEAHFATFPDALVEPCALAGSPAKCCPACGAPWRRVVEQTPAAVTQKTYAAATAGAVGRHRGLPERPGGFVGAASESLGWEPGCAHGLEPIGGTVLDPFCGRGTTLIVALRHGRRAVGFELNPEYAALARMQITLDCPMFNGTGEVIEAQTPSASCKQDALGKRTYTGFNARWDAREAGG